MDALFLDHYDRELAYLREMGSAFAASYPKLAGRLGLDEFQCSDPFVERLLEGFAFLSARVQRRLDAEYPQLTRALFDAIFPHYSRPIPAAGIFQLNPAHDEGSLVEGYRVPKGTRLHAEAARGQQTGCRFDTVTDVDLWPLRISHAAVFSRDSTSIVPVPRSFFQSSVRYGLWLTLETTAAVPFQKLSLDRLRLHLRGADIAHHVYEALIANTCSLAIAGGSSSEITADSWTLMDPKNLKPGGFDPNHGLLPSEVRSFSGYHLLQEYFMLPEKFMFIDIEGLRSTIQSLSGNRLHLLIALNQASSKLPERVSTEHFALHCVPAVNLFRRRADRIHLDQSQEEHQLISDRSRPLDFEIWSIEEMAAHANASKMEMPCLPLYAPPPPDATSQRYSFYYSIDRRPSLQALGSKQPPRSSYQGTEVFVHLTDSNESPRRAEMQQLSSLLYCTNRDLPLLAPESGWRTAFQVEAAGPIANVLCLTGPTAPRPPLLSDEGETAWRLVSHLTPNYLSLIDSEQGGATMLRELLQLYCNPTNPSSYRQIDGLRSVRQQPIVRRVPMSGPMTFARGVEIELQYDEEAFEGSGAFLLCSLLEQFFARYVGINSFTETRLVSNRRGDIYRWPARMGTTPVL